jgi:hypothetical protein
VAETIQTLSFPIRLTRTGSFATVEQNSDAHVDELLATAILTRPGERHLMPNFGIDDPAFVGWERIKLALHVADFGPNVMIDDVSIEQNSTGTERVVMSWRRPESWEHQP